MSGHDGTGLFRFLAEMRAAGYGPLRNQSLSVDELAEKCQGICSLRAAVFAARTLGVALHGGVLAALAEERRARAAERAMAVSS